MSSSKEREKERKTDEEKLGKSEKKEMNEFKDIIT